VTRALGTQVSRYVFGPRAEFSRTLRDDAAIVRATELLRNVNSPAQLMTRLKS